MLIEVTQQIPIEQPNILIVDDEPFNLIVLESLLNEFNLTRISKAFNGRQALEDVIKNAERYDVIFTDN